tara:strand:- start:164 stop:664 length:501 start_codon:yes stop_codon:yes gene_type:complete
MSITNLRENVNKLKDQYLDCSQCPPAENCCQRFGDNLRMNLYPSMVLLLGMKKIRILEEEGKLILTRNGLQIRGTCPLYNKGCTIHEKKEEMGLAACLQFPLTVVKDLFSPYSTDNLSPGIVADFRCPQIEESWSELRKDLERIAQEEVPIFRNVREDYKQVLKRI